MKRRDLMGMILIILASSAVGGCIVNYYKEEKPADPSEKLLPTDYKPCIIEGDGDQNRDMRIQQIKVAVADLSKENFFGCSCDNE